MIQENKRIEFFKEKREHREEMREFLPSELQLEFPQKKKWSFGGKLLRLRNSKEPEDELFFEKLRMEIKKRMGKEITEEEKEKIERLEKEKKESKEKLVNSIEPFILILKALKDADCDVRKAAAEQIQYLPENQRKEFIPKIIENIKKDIEDPDYFVHQAAVEQIQYLPKDQRKDFILKIIENIKKDIESPFPLIRQAAVEQIQYFPEDQRKNFISKALKDAHCDVRKAAVEQIQYLPEDQRKDFIPKIIENIKKDIESSFPWIRQTAVEQIQHLPKDQRKNFILKALKDADRDVHQTAVEQIQYLPEDQRKDFIPKIIENIKKDIESSFPWIHQAAVEQIQYLPEDQRKDFIPKIIENIKKDIESSFPWIRQAAVEQIQYLPKDQRKNFILKTLKDADRDVHQAAVEQIQYLPKDQRKDFILKALKDADCDVRKAAVGQIQYLPENQRKNFILKALKDAYYIVRKAAVGQIQYLLKEMPKNTFSKLDSIKKILDKKVDKNYQLYFYQITASLLRSNQDLGKVLSEYFPSFKSLRKYGKEINQELSEEKKTKDVDGFFKKYQSEIAKLNSLDLNLSNSFLMSHLKNFGFPRLEKCFKNVVRYFQSKKLKEILPKIKDINGEYFFRIIEIFSAYQKMNLEGKLDNLIKGVREKKGKIKAKDLIHLFGKNLLKEFSKKLKIEAKIKKDKFNQWNLEYLPKLFTAESGYKKEDKELLKLIMKLSFQEDNFLNSILGELEGGYNQEEKDYLEKIKKYNLKVKEEFGKNGLDYGKWLNYPEKKEILIGITPDQLKRKREIFFKNLLENIKELLGYYKEKKKGILSESQAKKIYQKVIKKYGIQFKENEIVHSQKGRISFKDIGIILKEFNQLVGKYKEEEKEKNNQEKERKIGTILDHLKEIEKRIPDIEKETMKRGYKLSIGLWQRNPGYDIFQGNYTHCCVAVEGANRRAMLDYLIDTNLQVVEIKDEIKDKTIAQTWLWLAKDNQNNLNLVLDNVEINGDYTELSDKIRKNLFDYLKNYINYFGKEKIKRIVLGTSFNDVPEKDLKLINLTISKLAGSPREEEYLDAMYPLVGDIHFINPEREKKVKLFEVAEMEKEN